MRNFSTLCKCLLACCMLAIAFTARATTHVVSNNNDSGAGSLRQAIADAIATGVAPLVIDATGVSGMINLTTGSLNISKAMTINGPGSAALTVDAGDLSRVFNISAGPMNINGIQIQNGKVTGADGGGIFASAAVNLSDCILNSNEARQGGAIYLASGSFTSSFSNCRFTGNYASSNGCITNASSFNMTDCYVENNDGVGKTGGGLWLMAGTVNIDRCFIRGNNSSLEGNGVDVEGATVTVSNTVISGNKTGESGGGVLLNVGTATLINCTITGNQRGGISHFNVPLNMYNCIVSGNVNGVDYNHVGGTLNASYNIVTTVGGTGMTNGVNNNIVGVPVCFVTPVPTAPSTGGDVHVYATSPAVNSGNNAVVIGSQDVEHAARIQSGTVDRGAYETNTAPSNEMDVKGLGTSIADGDITPSTSDDTDFGSTATGGQVSHTFTIDNLGGANLNLTGATKVTLSGTNASQFSVTLQPTSPLAPGGSTTFTIRYAPLAAGTHVATVNIANDDCDENPYNFNITGVGTVGGAALNFDGTNDYVNCGSASNLVMTNVITMEAWVNQSATSSDFKYIVNKEGEYEWAITNGTVWHALAIGSPYWAWVNTGVTVTPNQWTHLALVYDGTSIKVYKNGTLGNTTTASGNFGDFDPAFNEMWIGQRQNPAWQTNGYFNGKMDEVRIWNRALCQTEIQAHRSCELAGNENGLVAYYKFNHGIADGNNTGVTTLTDLAGGDNNGTLTNFGLSGTTSNWTAPGGVTTGLSCSPFLAPEINVQGNGQTILDGDNTPSATDNTDYGNVNVGSNLVRNFTIQNTGSGTLSISSITSTNPRFSVSGAPGGVGAGGSATFNVTFAPTSTGIQTGTIFINNNDCDEATYDFAVRGNGTPACTAPAFTACPSNVMANTASGSCSASVSYTAAASGSPSPSFNYAFSGATTGGGSGTGSGSMFNKGVTNVTIVASNTCGSTTCMFTVTVSAPAETCNGVDDDCDGLVDEGFDADGDGTADCFDGCPNDPNKTAPGICGCGTADVPTTWYADADNDGAGDPNSGIAGYTCDQPAGYVANSNDQCPEDPSKTAPGICGCGIADTDSDGDGTADCLDGCPNDPDKIAPGICGCGVEDRDSDNDGTADCNDGCPFDANKIAPGICGCGVADTDTDGDGTADCNDACPNDPNKIAPGVCGCGIADVPTTWYADADGDGAGDPNNHIPGYTCIQPAGYVANSNDQCPNDHNKTAPGACGCGVADVPTTWYADADNDGAGDPNSHIPGYTCIQPAGYVANSNDQCPGDHNKTNPGQCGCGVADVPTTWYADADNDGAGDPNSHIPGYTCIQPAGYVANSNDQCPGDHNKNNPGQCGCGVADTDSDGDGTANCHDGCPNDPNKIAPGQCGCGNADTDSDGDGVANCLDNCDFNANPTQTDSDCDGRGNACDVCPGGNDMIDNNNDGQPDCKYPPVYAQIIAAWKCPTGGAQKVYVCHNGNTLCVAYSALSAHIGHGDYLGSCNNASCGTGANFNQPEGAIETLQGVAGIDVFPNPATEKVNILLHGLETETATELIVYDQLGKAIWSKSLERGETEVSIDLNDKRFPNGMYFVTVKGENLVKRFVVTKG